MSDDSINRDCVNIIGWTRGLHFGVAKVRPVCKMITIET